MKKLLSLLLVLCLAFSLASCKKKEEKPEDPEPVVKNELYQLNGPSAGDTVITILTSQGEIRAVVYPSAAPKNVANFLKLAESGYYDELLIHKTIENFCIQMGDPTLKGDGGEAASGRGVVQEYHDLLHHFTGALAMAAGEDGLNHSQFYIVAGGEITDEHVQALKNARYAQNVIDAYKELGGQPNLDYRYTVFGQVYEGLELVKQLSAVKTDDYNRPKKDIELLSVVVSTYGKN